jgi:hypothetical protein
MTLVEEEWEKHKQGCVVGDPEVREKQILHSAERRFVQDDTALKRSGRNTSTGVWGPIWEITQQIIVKSLIAFV